MVVEPPVAGAAVRVVELDNDSAVDHIEDWGYYRDIPADEHDHSKFFTFGPHVIWWLNRNVLCSETELSLHICVEPGHRRRLYGRKLLYAFQIVAELLRARRLITWMPKDSPVTQYLGRMGWVLLPDRGADGLEAWSVALGTGGPDGEFYEGE